MYWKESMQIPIARFSVKENHSSILYWIDNLDPNILGQVELGQFCQTLLSVYMISGKSVQFNEQIFQK